MFKNRSSALVALTIAAAALGGCAVYTPGPRYGYAPGYYAPAYAPYGYYGGGGVALSVHTGGGWGHGHRW